MKIVIWRDAENFVVLTIDKPLPTNRTRSTPNPENFQNLDSDRHPENFPESGPVQNFPGTSKAWREKIEHGKTAPAPRGGANLTTPAPPDRSEDLFAYFSRIGKFGKISKSPDRRDTPPDRTGAPEEAAARIARRLWYTVRGFFRRHGFVILATWWILREVFRG